MTTNQEGRQAAIRDSTSTAYGVAADWNALFDDAGISAGTFNERLLAWINAELSASHSNLVSAMQAYAEDAGYDGWEDMATLVLAMNGAETLLDGETQGLAFDFTDQSALIIDTGTPANNYDSTGIVSSGSLVGPSGKLTYTSPSNKLTLQSDGVMRYQAHNLITYSEQVDHANWGKNGSPTVTADADGNAELWTPAASPTQHWIRSSAYTSIIGATYVLSLRVKPAGYTNIQLFSGSVEGGATSYCNYVLSGNGSIGTQGATATGTISAVGNGYYDISLTYAAIGATTAYLYMCSIQSSTATRNETWAPDGVSGYYVTRGHVYRYPANTDYIRTSSSAVYALPIEYDTSGNCLGLLVEEARTNLLVGSATAALHAASNTSLLNATITSGQADVSGGTAAGLITASVAVGRHLIYSAVPVTVSSGTVYTLSCLMKAGTSQYGHLQIANSGGGTERYGAVFDLSGAGSVTDTDTNSTSPANTATSIKSIGNGWYRCSLTMSSSTSTAQFWHIGLSDSATPTWSAASPHWNASGTETVYYCYPQIEQGSFPTSPILTYGAAATRAADNISIALSATPIPDFTSSAHTIGMFAEYISRATVGSAIILSISDSSSSDYASIYENGSRLPAFVYVTSNAGGQGANLFDAAGQTEGATVSIAARLKEDDVAVSYTGRSQDTDSTADLAGTAFDLIGIGRHYSAGQPSKIIRKIVFVPSEWSNATLEAKVGN